MATERHYSPVDRLLLQADAAMRTLLPFSVQPYRPSPAIVQSETKMSDVDTRHVAGLMRINHTGEVCAQALYQAQALSARTPALRRQMTDAAREETDHLAWTQQRLDELGARPSWLNPLWYAGAFGIGLLAGRAGDHVSLGFVVETERQVEQHLAGHLERLPPADARSRAIVAAMHHDERRHADAAAAAGAVKLPLPVRLLMRGAAKVMTGTAYYL